MTNKEGNVSVPFLSSFDVAKLVELPLTKKFIPDRHHFQLCQGGLNCDEFRIMSDKETFSAFFRENRALLREYLELRMDLFRLQGIRVISRSFSMLVVALIVALMALFVLLFLGLAFAWWIAGITGSNIIGFASAAGLFMLLLVLVILLRRPLFQNPLIRLFIEESVSDQEDEDTDQ